MNLVKLLAVVPHHTLHRQIKLTDEHALAIAIRYGTHLSHDLVYAWQVLVVVAQLASSGWITRLPNRIHRIITELLILEQPRKYVDAETIDATVEPEAQDIIHSLANLLVAPVQIRLFHIELVQVVLPGVFIELPGRPVKSADPVIGWTSIGGRITPGIPVAFFVVAARTRQLEPGMLIGRVVGDKVQNKLEVTLMCLLKQSVQVL